MFILFFAPVRIQGAALLVAKLTAATLTHKEVRPGDEEPLTNTNGGNSTTALQPQVNEPPSLLREFFCCLCRKRKRDIMEHPIPPEERAAASDVPPVPMEPAAAREIRARVWLETEYMLG